MVDIKLEFCKLAEEHLEKVNKMRNLPQVHEKFYTDHYIPLEETKEWFKRVCKNPTNKQWIIKVDDLLVGYVSLDGIDLYNKRCSWGYFSTSKKMIFHHIELNVMNHVFEDLKFNKLMSEVFSFNKIVIKIHERFGSKIDGVLRKHIYKNGEFRDIVVMSIFRDEWLKNKDKYKYIKVKME